MNTYATNLIKLSFSLFIISIYIFYQGTIAQSLSVPSASAPALVSYTTEGIPFTFQESIGNTLTDKSFGVKEKSSTGELVSSGYTSSLSGSSITTDAFLQCYDANGNSKWGKLFGTTSKNEEGKQIIVANDGGFVIAGHTESYGKGSKDAMLIKTDANGNMLWAKCYGNTAEDYATTVIQTSTGDIVFGGYSNSSSKGGYDAYVVKTNSSGTVSFSKQFGSTKDELVQAITTTTDGGFAVCGYTKSSASFVYESVFLTKLNASGTIQWTKVYGAADGANYGYGIYNNPSDNGFYIVGNSQSFGIGANKDDILVIRINSSGTVLWAKTYGGTDLDAGKSIVGLADGSLLISGYSKSSGTSGLEDGLVMKIDADGNVIYSKLFGATLTDQFNFLSSTADGGVVVSGCSQSYGAGLDDINLCRLNAELKSGFCLDNTIVLAKTSRTITTSSITFSTTGKTTTTTLSSTFSLGNFSNSSSFFCGQDPGFDLTTAEGQLAYQLELSGYNAEVVYDSASYSVDEMQEKTSQNAAICVVENFPQSCDDNNILLDKYLLKVIVNTGSQYLYGVNNSFNLSLSANLKIYEKNEAAFLPSLPLAAELYSKSFNLTINEKQPEQVFLLDISEYYTNYSSCVFMLNSFDFNSDFEAIKNAIQLSFSIEPIYNIDVSLLEDVITIEKLSEQSSNPTTFTWNSNLDCEIEIPNYEIQILKLQNIGTSEDFIDKTDAVKAIVDWNSALSIETESPNKSLNITLTDGSGFYIWRIRPIGNYYEGGIGNSQNWGKWSNAPLDGQTIAYLNKNSLDDFAFYYNQFDEDINWEHTRIFSEGSSDIGQFKTKESISYYDNLFRNKQNQSILNSQANTLSNQLIYNYSGKAAVQTLSVPLKQQKFGYHDNLLTNTSDELFTAKDFDSDNESNYYNYTKVTSFTSDISGETTLFEESLPYPIATNPNPASGVINEYYSDENEDLNIPNAGNYPYSVALSDGLGRVKTQTLLGDEHRLGFKDTSYVQGGKARTIRTFYSHVPDTLLIELLGEEAPADSAVYAVYTSDPNENTSFTINTLDGQMLASGLINTGDHPMLSDITDNSKSIKQEISKKHRLSTNAFSKEDVISIVAAGTTLNLSYTFDVAEFSANCVDFCSSCDYYVYLYVIEESTNIPVWEEIIPINPVACGTSSTLRLNYNDKEGNGINISEPGNYRIGRVVTVDANYIDDEGVFHDNYSNTVNDTVSELMKDELSQFEELVDLLNTTNDVNDLYTYLDSITSEAKLSGTSISPLGLGGGSIIKLPSLEVSFDETLGEFGEYIVSTTCCSINIPKIPCDYNPCENLKVETTTDPEVSWDDDLIAKYGYYYDFESLLYEKWGDEFGFGENLLYYFYDKYGNFKLSPLEKEYHINITLALAGDGEINTGAEEFYGKPCFEPENAPAITLKVYDASGNLIFGEINLELDEEDFIDTSGTIYYTTDGGEYSSSFHYIYIYESDYPEIIKNKIASSGLFSLSTGGVGILTPGVDYEISANEYSVTISYSTRDEYAAELTQEFAFEFFGALEGNSKSTFDIDVLEGQITDDIYTSDDFMEKDRYNLSSMKGLFNTLIANMINDSLNPYDCNTLYYAWENKVNIFDQTFKQIGNETSGSGYDLLESFLQAVGTQYQEISNHAFFSDDELNPLLDKDAYGKKYYGNGYLEYAYKAIKLDINSDPTLSAVEGEKFQNCFDIFNFDIDFNAVPLANEPILNTPSYWSAWDNAPGAAWLADSREEVDSLQTWKLFYGCINSNFGESVLLLDNTISSCSGLPDLDCLSNFTESSKDAIEKHLYSRQKGFYASVLLNQYVKPQTEDENGARIISYDDKLKALERSINIINILKPALELTINNDGTHALSIGTSEAFEYIRSLYQDVLVTTINESDFITEGLSKSIDGILNPSNYLAFNAKTINKSSILTNLLNFKISRHLQTNDSLNIEDINEWLNEWPAEGWNFTTTEVKGSKSTYSVAIPKNEFEAGEVMFLVNAATKTIELNFARLDNPDYKKTKFIIDYDDTQDAALSIDAIYVKWDAPSITVAEPIEKTEDCNALNVTYLISLINNGQRNCLKSEIRNSLKNYTNTCSNPQNIHDKLIVQYVFEPHHITLFQYDVAGNLVEVIPPKGVDEFEYTYNADGEATNFPSRNDSKTHSLKTQYAYNSLGQKIFEKTPDGGFIKYWYNPIGQIRFSQSEEQITKGSYNYIKYDELGRITETGQSKENAIDQIFVDNIEDVNFPDNKLSNLVITVYDKQAEVFSFDPLSETEYEKFKIGNGASYEQEFLQNRVSYIYHDIDGNISTTNDQDYTYYSYDPHGNVKWIIQEIQGFAPKYIAYDYDVYTSKVKMVKYNEGFIDQFFHQYTYDADNRIKKVSTSKDGIIWETDAQYEYYAHGPLKRLSMGHDNIQGLDYVYTINGWLKALNHQSLNPTYDPGNDGGSSSLFANDAFGNTLSYFDGDFKRKKESDYSPYNSVFNDINQLAYANYDTQREQYINSGINQQNWDLNVDDFKAINYYQLFDGHITNISYNTAYNATSTANYKENIKANAYSYDELYRLVSSVFDYYNPTAAVPAWQYNKSFTDYKTDYAYDDMGNISSLNRYTYNKKQIDKFNYHYATKDGEEINQLNYIDDAITSSGLTTDLKDQSKDNYRYDKLGRLIYDRAEGITNIVWNNSLNKPDSVYKVLSTGYYDTLAFNYDALGNKIKQTHIVQSGTGLSGKALTDTVITYYVYDANGVLMSMYKKETDSLVKQMELPIMASDRIGNYNAIGVSFESDSQNQSIDAENNIYSRNTGNKSFELKDYLGNVRAVVKDERTATINADASLSNIQVDLISTTDYYPYGMEMPNAGYNSSEYRYGHQGKEKMDEFKTNGNAYDFGARILDPRVGRWLSMDPLAAKYPSSSPYAAMGNDPVNMVDPDGKEPIIRSGTYQGESYELYTAEGMHQLIKEKIVSWKPNQGQESEYEQTSMEINGQTYDYYIRKGIGASLSNFKAYMLSNTDLGVKNGLVLYELLKAQGRISKAIETEVRLVEGIEMNDVVEVAISPGSVTVTRIQGCPNYISSIGAPEISASVVGNGVSQEYGDEQPEWVYGNQGAGVTNEGKGVINFPVMPGVTIEAKSGGKETIALPNGCPDPVREGALGQNPLTRAINGEE